MCLACQMDDEMWFAYLDQVARQEKASAADAARPAEDGATPQPKAEGQAGSKPAPSSPFWCEELPPE